MEALPLYGADTLSAGDMLRKVGGAVTLARTGVKNILGVAQETVDGGAGASIKVITDADAVYGVDDAFVRAVDERLDLAGVTGLMGVRRGTNRDLTVVLESAAADETLVRFGSGMHADERLSGGQLNAALAREIVRAQREYLGRGPKKARAFFRDNVVVVLMEDVMTRAEHSLIATGAAEAVLDVRAELQRVMREDLSATVERLTGRKVIAFMSANHVDPDMAVEVFVLDRPVAAAAADDA